MIKLFKQIADFIHAENSNQAGADIGVAQDLMERAEADAGRNPAEAAELRDAARAYLSVVR